jgi:hypothetical protein
MTNFEYYKTLTIGVIIGASTVILAFYMVKPEPPISPEPPVSTNVEKHGTFTVVSEYKGCDVVRYTDGSMATYKYFLDCTDSMRNK